MWVLVWLRLTAAPSHLRAPCHPLDLSLQSTALLGKPFPPHRCSLSAEQMPVERLLLRALGLLEKTLMLAKGEEGGRDG